MLVEQVYLPLYLCLSLSLRRQVGNLCIDKGSISRADRALRLKVGKLLVYLCLGLGCRRHVGNGRLKLRSGGITNETLLFGVLDLLVEVG